MEYLYQTQITVLPDGSSLKKYEAEAAPLVEVSGAAIVKVAPNLNIYDSTLGNSVHQISEEAAGPPTAAERAGTRALKRELARVCRERDILGKPVAYFSTPNFGEQMAISCVYH